MGDFTIDTGDLIGTTSAIHPTGMALQVESEMALTIGGTGLWDKKPGGF
jgi:hypothetical protein